ncbi:MAG: NusG domain II-containing protein [Actinomycetota bacterium]|jgi:hypothetical protein|nr:NusG domain II-containing protein [Actinomycetota bacterium]
MRKVLTRGDVGLLVILVIATLTAVPAMNIAAGYSDGTAIISSPSGTTTVDLDEPATYVIEGRTGVVTFRVSDEGLRCIDSDCADHICVRTGLVSVGHPVVCAPQGVTAMLSAGRSGDVDAVSR